MEDKELRKLNRADLIEIIYILQKNEQAMQEEIDSLKKQLDDRHVVVEQSGSLADVLATLNGLFEAAQTTADEYIEEAKKTREEAITFLKEARHIREQADNYASEVKEKVAKLASITIKQRDKMMDKSEEESKKQLAQPSRIQKSGFTRIEKVHSNTKESTHD